uniref:Uncharacterized protein n=1 Tax=Anopheles atroparvus TaxID=41427 RepID=A0AAG5D202_ANOAO
MTPRQQMTTSIESKQRKVPQVHRENGNTLQYYQQTNQLQIRLFKTDLELK